MESNKVGILIVGASGFIGSELLKQAKQKGFCVEGTYFNSFFEKTANMQKLDLSLDECHLQLTKKIMEKPEKIAVFCSAISSIDYCIQNRTLSFKVNVENTLKLMNYLSQLGFKILFISSDYVFNGIHGFYSESDKTDPINEYGRQKEVVEKFLLPSLKSALVLRISKIFSAFHHNKNLFSQWHDLITRKKDIHCIKNNVFSPTSREDLAKAILVAIEKKMTGLYHVSSASWKRADLAELFLKLADKQYRSKVIEKKMDYFGFTEKRPLDSSLNSEKFKTQSGFEFTSMDKVIQNYFYFKIQKKKNLKI